MGIMEELKRLARPYEDEEEDYQEEKARPTPIEAGRKSTPSDADYIRVRDEVRAKSAPRTSAPAPVTPITTERPKKVVNMSVNTTTQLKVVLVRPERFDDASEIADHLRDKRTVVLNLETTQKDIARRLIDFLSGVAYAQEGKIKKVAVSTYIITPYNVDIIGDQDILDELQSSGVYTFRS